MERQTEIQNCFSASEIKESDQNSTKLSFSLNDGIRAEITVPHEALEWFLDVYHENALFISSWYDHYQNDEGENQKEMFEDLKGLAGKLKNGRGRLTETGNWLFSTKKFEVQVSGTIHNIIEISNFKIGKKARSSYGNLE